MAVFLLVSDPVQDASRTGSGRSFLDGPPPSASALPDEQSQGGRGAPEPAPARAGRHAGGRPLPRVPEGAGCLGPGTLHPLLQDPGRLG